MPASQIEQLGELYDWLPTHPQLAPELETQQVHLWQCPLTLTARQHAQALLFLNDTQRDKYARRMTAELKQSYLAGRYYLMTLLAAYSGLEPTELKLSYTRLNKPYLNPNPLGIQFNFTDTMHDGTSVGLFAFARGLAVGVDIEHFARLSNFAAIASRRFSPAEIQYVTQPDGAIDRRRFLAYWTRKEAYGKAAGKGINFRMCETDLASPGSFHLNFTEPERPYTNYRLQQIQISQELIATLVSEGHQPLAIQTFKSANHIP